LLAAIEVSTRISSVALLDLVSGEELAEAELPSEWESSATLIPALEALLQQQSLTVQDLAAVAVSIGPGSFTGIRVGIATAEGICMPSNLLAFGIPTLDGLAENIRAAELYGETLCLVDAQRGQCFTGHYDVTAEDIHELEPPQILGIESLHSIIHGRTWIVGPGALKYEKEVRESMGTQALFAFNAFHKPRAMSIARLAYRRWKLRSRPTIADLKPLYLRPPAVDEKQNQ
jgi:tRNA threonylcarbamoyladenosine biosynthesis protein TsaB